VNERTTRIFHTAKSAWKEKQGVSGVSQRFPKMLAAAMGPIAKVFAASRVAVIVSLTAIVPTVSHAQTAQQAPAVATSTSDEDETYPDLLDGTLSAEGDLEDDNAPKRGFFRFPTTLGPWLELKNNIRDNYGITIGGSYGVLWQNYSDSLIGLYNSVGSKFTLNVSAQLLNRGQPNALSFDMAIEDRQPLGTEEAPIRAGLAAGSISLTAATWGEFDNIGVSQAYIRQNLFDGRFQYSIGKLFAPNYVNTYPFFDDNRQFLKPELLG
jgi:porin